MMYGAMRASNTLDRRMGRRILFFIYISKSLLSTNVGIMVRERGMPERINKNSLGVRVARGP